MQDIQDFHIGTAYYIIENKKGSKLKLSLNYAQNSFKFKVLIDNGNIERLKVQAEIAAKNMLGKKAQKNLRDRLITMEV